MNSGKSAFLSMGKQDHILAIETLKSHLCIGQMGLDGVQKWRWGDCHTEEKVLSLESARLGLDLNHFFYLLGDLWPITSPF